MMSKHLGLRSLIMGSLGAMQAGFSGRTQWANFAVCFGLSPRVLRRSSPKQFKRHCSLIRAAAGTMPVATDRVLISERMQEIKAAGKVAFIPFLMAGDPNIETTKQAILALDEVGADVIELGVPYSDPLADGPTIQAAHTRGLLQAHVSLDDVLELVREVAPRIKAPILVFQYLNPIMARGLEKYCRQAGEAGASGLLVPDIPLEETGEIRRIASEAGLELVLLTTPTTPRERMQRIARESQGFVYLVSVTGVTGERATVSGRLGGLIDMMHAVTDKSVAVGFGVSGPDSARSIVQLGAEGVVVGSALVKALGESSSPEAGLAAMRKLAQSLRDAIPH